MPINLPQATATVAANRRLTLGAGRVFIGSAGVTPTTDIGYLRNPSLQVTRTRLEVQQGVPRTTVFQFVQAEEVIFNVTGLEWHIDRLQDVLGITNAATGTSGSGGGLLGFGGDTNIRNVAIHFQHQMPSGGTINMRIWSAQGQGEATFTFGDDVVELPLAFKAVISTTTWSNNALASNQQLVSFEIQPPPAGF